MPSLTVRDSLLRVGTTGVHENERGESGNLDEFFRETNFPRDVGEERESNEFDVLAGKRERIWTGERDVFRDIDRDDIGRVLTRQGAGDEGF